MEFRSSQALCSKTKEATKQSNAELARNLHIPPWQKNKALAIAMALPRAMAMAIAIAVALAMAMAVAMSMAIGMVIDVGMLLQMA